MIVSDFNIVSSASRMKEAERRAEREREIERLGIAIAQAKRMRKIELCSELLASLGFIHNDPCSRRKWENQ